MVIVPIANLVHIVSILNTLVHRLRNFTVRRLTESHWAMADSEKSRSETNTPKAPKDKACPYCGQAFTSSSLGRHLDLYIKERNPKAPDGIHNVYEIQRIRGNVTRRQHKGSVGGSHRNSSTPLMRRSDQPDLARQHSETPSSVPAIPKHTKSSVASLGKVASSARRESADVNDGVRAGDDQGGGGCAGGPWAGKKTPGQRNVSKQAMQKTQLDAKQKAAEALDTARAAELALRELVGSLRAAK